MVNMASLSTSALDNAICNARRQQPGSICQKCYASSLIKQYSALRNKLKRNMAIYSKVIIPWEQLPLLNIAYFRIEAFGDVSNSTQCVNYINFIRKNRHIKFGWWSKNLNLIKTALKRLGLSDLPSNCKMVYSEPVINCNDTTLDSIKQKYPFVDKIFIVRDDVEGSCGKNCFKCLTCYRSNEHNTVIEKLK